MTDSEEKYWMEEIDGLEGLSNIEKWKAKEALRKITTILGRNTSLIAKEQHPIMRYVFVNYAPWTWR